MNLVWRFYVDQEGQWRWQQVAVDRSVVADSPRSFKVYDECLADAERRGYKFSPSQARGTLPKRYSDRRR